MNLLGGSCKRSHNTWPKRPVILKRVFSNEDVVYDLKDYELVDCHSDGDSENEPTELGERLGELAKRHNLAAYNTPDADRRQPTNIKTAFY